MKDIIDKPASFNRVEFWAATTIFVFLVFFFITDGLQNGMAAVKAPNEALFDQARVSFNYYKNYFVPSLIRYSFLFLAFLFLNFMVVPKLIRKEGVVKNISWVILLLVLSGLLLGTTDTYLKSYLFAAYKTVQDTYDVVFQNSFLFSAWLLLVFGFYSIIKYIGHYLVFNSNSIQARYRSITREGITAFVIWMVSLFFLIVAEAQGEIALGWAIVIPCGILFYWYSFHSLIPKSILRKRPFLSYLGKTLLLLVISYLPVSLLIVLFTQRTDPAFAISSFNSVVQLLVTAPLLWVLFKRQVKGNEEVYTLKKELGQTSANFDFLRSQINPHFLFNALNTIYGTAIQEGAERTGEGIEKLGDMMRFMLQENMQEKISLAREIDYLKNYISLQKLRIDSNPIISIEAEIEQPVATIQIAPMLLIPFIENAFKYGISFREPSYIRITLEVRGNTLYYDVNNSTHAKPENDPEKERSGIGLSNVQQRLQLLYPGKHELIIRGN